MPDAAIWAAGIRTDSPSIDCYSGSAQAALLPVVNGAAAGSQWIEQGAFVVTVPRRLEEETRSAGLRRWADECRQVVRVLASRSDGLKTGQIYDIIGTQNLYGEESLFINFGYWKNNPTTMDDASAAARHRICRGRNSIDRARRFPAAGQVPVEEIVRA